MNPRIIRAFQKGQQEKMEQDDFLNWLSGNYFMSALDVAVDKILSGRKAKAKYIEKPIFPEYIEQSSMSEEEREERDMKLEISKMEQWIAHDANCGLPQTNL